MNNLGIYNSLRTVPKQAQRTIAEGRLKGLTEINPMWRIKALTEQFGPCGIGWKLEIISKEIYPAAGGEQVATVDINLYIRHGGEWSAPIPGTGGSRLVAVENGGSVTSDECFKMAFTDAIGVACKMLGVGADIYWEKDPSKYETASEYTCCVCGKKISREHYDKSMEANGKAYCSGTCKKKDPAGGR